MQAGDFYFKATLGEQVLSPFDGNSPLTLSYFNKNSIQIQSSNETTSKLMAMQISSGGLAYKYNASQVAMSSSIFGVNPARAFAFIIGVLIVASIFAMVIMFQGFGVASSLSLLMFSLIFVLMLNAIPGIALSVASMLGIILAMIMAVDGSIITIKRIKEEYATGKTVKSASRFGFKRALVPVVNTGVIGVIISLLLFLLTNAQVKAFAITFGIGSVIAVITSLLLVRMWTAILLPLSKNKAKFFNLKREEE